MKKETTQKNTKSTQPKTLDGVVVSTKMKDTVVVLVNRFVKHARYGKYYSRSKKYKAHDEGNTKKEGDKVTIVETRPISKDKHFKVVA
jgi:small subunit ribosomal protein S17